MSSNQTITRLLNAWEEGDKQAETQLIKVVEKELRFMVHRRLSQEPQAPFQTTELFHELYIKLAVSGERIHWQNRHHFFGFAARILRQILVDAWRERTATKRGGGLGDLVFNPELIRHREKSLDFGSLNLALDELEQADPLKFKIVMLRFFGGFTVSQTARELKLAEPTIKRHWALARAFLLHRMKDRDHSQGDPA